MKVGIIGVNGIGKYHVREFINAGCEVVWILEKNEVEAKKGAKLLSELYNLQVNPTHKINEFFKNELDIISIATPSELHSFYLNECLKRKVNIFCEKPFVNDTLFEDYNIAKKILKYAKDNESFVSVNTQWVNVIKYLDLESIGKIKRLKIYMEAGAKRLSMLKEHLPHTNSILLRLIPNGQILNINFLEKKEDHIIINFIYSNLEDSCSVDYEFKYKKDRPRKVFFSINDLNVRRDVKEGYKQYLVINNKEIEIEDPFKDSISNFVKAVKYRDKKLLPVSEEEILKNMFIQDEIIKCYLTH